MTQQTESMITRKFREGTPIDRAMNRAVQAAIEAHRQAGVPLVVWRDGRVVYLDPITLEEVPPPEDAAAKLTQHNLSDAASPE